MKSEDFLILKIELSFTPSEHQIAARNGGVKVRIDETRTERFLPA